MNESLKRQNGNSTSNMKKGVQQVINLNLGGAIREVLESQPSPEPHPEPQPKQPSKPPTKCPSMVKKAVKPSKPPTKCPTKKKAASSSKKATSSSKSAPKAKSKPSMSEFKQVSSSSLKKSLTAAIGKYEQLTESGQYRVPAEFQRVPAELTADTSRASAKKLLNWLTQANSSIVANPISVSTLSQSRGVSRFDRPQQTLREPSVPTVSVQTPAAPTAPAATGSTADSLIAELSKAFSPDQAKILATGSRQEVTKVVRDFVSVGNPLYESLKSSNLQSDDSKSAINEAVGRVMMSRAQNKPDGIVNALESSNITVSRTSQKRLKFLKQSSLRGLEDSDQSIANLATEILDDPNQGNLPAIAATLNEFEALVQQRAKIVETLKNIAEIEGDTPLDEINQALSASQRTIEPIIYQVETVVSSGLDDSLITPPALVQTPGPFTPPQQQTGNLSSSTNRPSPAMTLQLKVGFFHELRLTANKDQEDFIKISFHEKLRADGENIWDKLNQQVQEKQGNLKSALLSILGERGPFEEFTTGTHSTMMEFSVNAPNNVSNSETVRNYIANAIAVIEELFETFSTFVQSGTLETTELSDKVRKMKQVGDRVMQQDFKSDDEKRTHQFVFNVSTTLPFLVRKLSRGVVA